MSKLSDISNFALEGLKDHASKALETIREGGENASKEAQDAVDEYQQIIQTAEAFADYPEKRHSIMESGARGLTNKLAAIANENVRRTFTAILEDSLKAATSLLGGALKLFVG